MQVIKCHLCPLVPIVWDVSRTRLGIAVVSVTGPELIQPFWGPPLLTTHLASADRMRPWGVDLPHQPKGMPWGAVSLEIQGLSLQEVRNKPCFINGYILALSWYSLKPRCTISFTFTQGWKPTNMPHLLCTRQCWSKQKPCLCRAGTRPTWRESDLGDVSTSWSL